MVICDLLSEWPSQKKNMHDLPLLLTGLGRKPPRRPKRSHGAISRETAVETETDGL